MQASHVIAPQWSPVDDVSLQMLHGLDFIILVDFLFLFCFVVVNFFVSLEQTINQTKKVQVSNLIKLLFLFFYSNLKKKKVKQKNRDERKNKWK